MNTELTFEEAIEQIKESSEKARETVEVAEQIAEIINAITDARIEQGLSQRDLARKSGIKQSAIARMESIQVVPRLDTLIKIARCLGIKLKAEKQESIKGSASIPIFYLFDYSSMNNEWENTSYTMRPILKGVV